ncbi:MAG: phage terminase large subunit family protein [Armatimonadota bacterium]
MNRLAARELCFRAFLTWEMLMERGELLRFLSTPCGLLSAVFKLEPYQARFLNDASMTRVVLKSRQVGFSWLFAAEAVAKTCMVPGHHAIFVSLSREEAQEKIRYALEIWNALPPLWRPRLVRQSRTALEFAGGARIVSHPCKAPRGRSAADLYLDELAFYRDDADVLAGSLPVISRGGRITLASTPFGKRGAFWRECEARLTGRRPGILHTVPWWHCSWLCTDVPSAKQQAEEMDTPHRVRTFGSPRLHSIAQQMELESFRQEYECVFADADASWVPYDEILPCVRDDLEVCASTADITHCTGELYAGFDVGRTRHASELVVLEKTGARLSVRAVVTMKAAEYRVQKQCLEELMALRGGIVRRLCIDATGIGSALAEEMAQAHPLRVEPVIFTARVKEDLAVGLRVAFQSRDIEIPADRGLISQIHAVRRAVTSAGNARFDADDQGHEHADRFWALALALHAARSRRPMLAVRRV